jgi:hypothetical protein
MNRTAFALFSITCVVITTAAAGGLSASARSPLADVTSLGVQVYIGGEMTQQEGKHRLFRESLQRQHAFENEVRSLVGAKLRASGFVVQDEEYDGHLLSVRLFGYGAVSRCDVAPHYVFYLELSVSKPKSGADHSEDYQIVALGDAADADLEQAIRESIESLLSELLALQR